MKFGLNLRAPPKKFGVNASSSKPVVKKNVLGDESDEETQDAGLSAKELVNKQLQAVQSKLTHADKLQIQKTLSEDPTIYDFDGAYDEIKKKELIIKKQREGEMGEDGRKKSRYMENLFKAAELRKRENERAEQRKIQKEREMEQEEFGDKEKFVTEAYKQRQQEIKLLEEQERKKDAQEQDAIKHGDMSGFRKSLLTMMERPDDSELTVSEETMKEIELELQERERENKLKMQKAVEAGVIQINDSDEIVDKRQLLVGGLNISAAKKRQLEKEKEFREQEIRRKQMQQQQELDRKDQEKQRQLELQRQRARALILEQQAEKEEKLRQQQELEKEELARKMAKKATNETISDAKARYLARKKMEQGQKSDSDSD